MNENLYDDIAKQIREVAKDVKGVINTEKCYIRKSGMKYHVDLHATVNANISVKQGHIIAHNLKNWLKRETPELADVLIYIEPNI